MPQSDNLIKKAVNELINQYSTYHKKEERPVYNRHIGVNDLDTKKQLNNGQDLVEYDPEGQEDDPRCS